MGDLVHNNDGKNFMDYLQEVIDQDIDPRNRNRGSEAHGPCCKLKRGTI